MIGPRTIETMKKLIMEQIDNHAPKMDEAFMNADDGKLKVSIGVDIGVSETPDSLDVGVTMSFTAEKVKDKIIGTVSERQLDLPLEGAKTYKLAK